MIKMRAETYIQRMSAEEEGEHDWLNKVRKFYAGEVHSHSVRSNRDHVDGAAEPNVHRDSRVMQYADKLGLQFVVFSEHSSDTDKPKRLLPEHQICQSLLAQQAEIDELNSSGEFKPKAFSGVEANIIIDEHGQAMLDVPDNILNRLDLVIASRHGIPNQRDPEKIRQTLMAAVTNPEVDIIGHPYRGIEFYDNDWQYFKKYCRDNDPETFEALSKIDEEKDNDSIRQVVGKSPTTGNDQTEDLHKKFVSLNDRYWQVWDELLDEMAKNGKAFEINLNAFVPGKSFYEKLLAKAASRQELKFSIVFDFHNLKQQANLKNDKALPLESGIKNPGRGKAIARLLGLVEILERNNISPERIINSSKENFDVFLDLRKRHSNEAAINLAGFGDYLSKEKLSLLFGVEIKDYEVVEAEKRGEQLDKFFIRCTSVDGDEFCLRKNDGYKMNDVFALMQSMNKELPEETSQPVAFEAGAVIAYKSIDGQNSGEHILAGNDVERGQTAQGMAELIGKFHKLDKEKFSEHINSRNYNLESIRCSSSVDLVEAIKKQNANLGVKLEELYNGMRDFESKILQESDLVLVHGDFHPGNVLVDKSGKVKLIDYKNMTLGVKERDLASMIEQINAQCSMGEKNKISQEQVEAMQKKFLNAYSDGFDEGKLQFYQAVISWRNAIYCLSKYFLGKKKKIDIDNGRVFLSKAEDYFSNYKARYA